MAKAKRKDTTPTMPSAPDAQLIRDCVHYSLAVASIHAAFKADPDTDNVYAERVADRCERQSNKVLAVISSTPAATFGGATLKRGSWKRCFMTMTICRKNAPRSSRPSRRTLRRRVKQHSMPNGSLPERRCNREGPQTRRLPGTCTCPCHRNGCRGFRMECDRRAR